MGNEEEKKVREAVEEISKEGRLSCHEALGLAERLGVNPRKVGEAVPNPEWVDTAKKEFLVSAAVANRAAEARDGDTGNLPFASLEVQMTVEEAQYVLRVLEGR